MSCFYLRRSLSASQQVAFFWVSEICVAWKGFEERLNIIVNESLYKTSLFQQAQSADTDLARDRIIQQFLFSIYHKFRILFANCLILNTNRFIINNQTFLYQNPSLKLPRKARVLSNMMEESRNRLENILHWGKWKFVEA